MLSLPCSPNRIWAPRYPFLGEISSLLCNAAFIDGISPKVCSKKEEDKDETQPLRNPTDYIQLAAVPKKLAPHSRQRIPFHSDLSVSARNDKLRAV